LVHRKEMAKKGVKDFELPMSETGAWGRKEVPGRRWGALKWRGGGVCRGEVAVM